MKQLFFTLLMPLGLFAQNSSFKTPVTGVKQIMIQSGAAKLQIVGVANLAEIELSTEDANIKTPEEAEGLKLVTPGGGPDNTGIGAFFDKKDNVVRLKIPKSKYYGVYVLKIPATVDLHVREGGNSYGAWLIENMAGEIDIKTSYTNTTLKEITGPLVAAAGYGKLNVQYAKLDQRNPNYISASSDINVTLPADSKANLKLKSVWGDVFTDFNLVSTAQPDENDWEDDDDDDEKIGPARPAQVKPTPKPKAAPMPKVAPMPAVVEIDPKALEDEINKAIKESQIAMKESQNAMKEAAKAHKEAMKDHEKTLKDQDKNFRYSFIYNSDQEDESKSGYDSTINGGGVNFKIVSQHGNVYLRKRK